MEKHERICAIKDRAISLLEMGMNQDVSCIDSKELYELMDIIKDCEEAIKYKEEATYYQKITDAMDKNSNEKNMNYIERYIPENKRYYKPMWDDMSDRDMWDNGMWDDIYPERRMRPHYYSEPSRSISTQNGSNTQPNWSPNNNNPNMNVSRDPSEGRAGITRKMYMDIKHDSSVDKTTKMKELENFMRDLADDMTEMIDGLDANEKATVKTKLTQLASKMA